MKAIRRVLGAEGPDCPVRSGLRRRGAALVEAIQEAARDELADVGYMAFSIESVAARAHTGKASIYRRWGDKQALVLDAIECALPPAPALDILDLVGRDTCTRDALLMVMRRLAQGLGEGRSDLFRAVASACARDAALADLVDTCVVQPRKQAMLRILQNGVERGEVRPAAVTLQVTEVGPAMIFHAVLTEGSPPPDEQIVSLVDNILMPILRPEPSARR